MRRKAPEVRQDFRLLLLIHVESKLCSGDEPLNADSLLTVADTARVERCVDGAA
jgi:hypothetical protein